MFGFSRTRYGGYDDYGSTAVNSLLAQLRRDEEMWRRDEERRRLRALQEKAAGSRRRQVELEKLGRFVPAGAWDADCEKWPEQSYTWDLGGGFTVQIMRNTMAWTWCGYVLLPEWFPHRDEHYNFWNGETSLDLPELPVREITFGGPKENGKYGFDHSWGPDLQPLARPLPGESVGPGCHPGCVYTTAEMARDEAIALASWFASLVLDGTLTVPADVLAAQKDHLYGIQQAEMRAVDNRRRAEAAAAAEAAKKVAEAAERAAAEAAAAAARAAEEAAAAAARAAEEAAAAKARRLKHVKKLLGEVEALRARRAAGETLKPEQAKKMHRKAELERELAELEA